MPSWPLMKRTKSERRWAEFSITHQGHDSQRPIQGQAPPPSNSLRGESIFQANQPWPVPRGHTAHVLEDLLIVGQHPALSLQIVDEGIWPPTLGRVFGSSFAGPRFWHGGVMLRRAEF